LKGGLKQGETFENRWKFPKNQVLMRAGDFTRRLLWDSEAG
jgi:hypothetical protein